MTDLRIKTGKDLKCYFAIVFQTPRPSQRFSESHAPSLHRPKQRQPRASRWNKPSQSTAIEVQYENDLREFETTPTPPVTVRQKGADRGAGLTVKKKIRGNFIDCK